MIAYETTWAFGQSWLPLNEPCFQAGDVHLAWTDKELRIHADLVDQAARGREFPCNYPAFQERDALEVFIGAMTDTGCQVWITISLEKLCDQSCEQWGLSFGRCDYFPGVEDAVISSTSAQRVCDFHRKKEWRFVDFRNHQSVLASDRFSDVKAHLAALETQVA